MPLAHDIRPEALDTYVGQAHLVGADANKKPTGEPGGRE